MYSGPAAAAAQPDNGQSDFYIALPLLFCHCVNLPAHADSPCIRRIYMGALKPGLYLATFHACQHSRKPQVALPGQACLCIICHACYLSCHQGASEPYMLKRQTNPIVAELQIHLLGSVMTLTAFLADQQLPAEQHRRAAAIRAAIRQPPRETPSLLHFPPPIPASIPLPTGTPSLLAPHPRPPA